jgi:hypothetical protein
MAKYSKKAQDKVEKVMHEMKHGTLRSGGSGKKVKSRKQAIAIGLSEAREAGAKVPKKATKKRAAKRSTATKDRPAKASPAKSASKTKRATKKTSAGKKMGMKKRG